MEGVEAMLQKLFRGLQVAVSAVAGWIVDLHATIQVLLLLMLCDVATGVALAWSERRLSSTVSRRGMTKKALMLVLVMTADQISAITGLRVAVPPFGDLHIGAALAVFYSISEALSIIENTQSYIPYPTWLTHALRNANAHSNPYSHPPFIAPGGPGAEGEESGGGPLGGDDRGSDEDVRGAVGRSGG